MKLVSSVTLSCILFAFINNLSLTFSIDDFVMVMDKNSLIVTMGFEYYIVPANSNTTGGGLSPVNTKTGDSKCPLTVVQEDKEDVLGKSLKFRKIKDDINDIIYTDTPLEIEFAKKPDCAESSKWLVYVDNVDNKKFVGIGGPQNYPGLKILNGTFNIQLSDEFGLDYKLVFCVEGATNCLDIGRYYNGDGGRRPLFLSDHHPHPFEIMFVNTVHQDGIIKSVA